MVQYYTLEQAAQILRVTPEQLKEMARKNEVRAFQDRGTWRFRSQEIDELARARGFGSDPELPLGEAKKTVVPEGGGQDVFKFSVDVDESDEVPIGQEPVGSTKTPSRSPTGTKKPATPPPSAPRSPQPKGGSSDSDVRLVLDGSDLDFHIDPEDPVKAPVSPVPKPSNKSRISPPTGSDSGVRIVPLEDPSDSDVKIVPAPASDSDIPVGQSYNKKPSDSDIRIEEQTSGRDRDGMVTEEIDLDAEERKALAEGKGRGKERPTPHKGSPQLPTSSPFELSEEDIDLETSPVPAVPSEQPDPDEAGSDLDSSSDFEISPLSEQDSSPVEPSSSDDVPLLRADDEVGLGELTGASGGSGINLQDPADSGISLEQGGSDEIEFELSLDSGSTPAQADPGPVEVDSSSEFELSLQDDGSSPTDTSSEFELSLDADGSSDLAVDESSSDIGLEEPQADSDSEFELTLDESGGLSPAEDSESGEDKDIFETDFEVPALDEESGSEAVALDEADTDLESSSDFDLSLEVGEESGSEVVPLEGEEEYDEGAATVQRKAVGGPAVEEDEAVEEDLGEALDDDLTVEPDLEAVEDEEEEAAVVSAAPAAPAEWGAMPALVLLPCTIILFVVGLMSFELMQGMWGYHKGTKVSNLVIDPIARMFDDTLPKE
jgi:excisionase family DNA binding protein